MKLPFFSKQSKHIQNAQQKNNQISGFLALHAAAQPVWSPRSSEAFAREGFMRNAVAYRCVRMIAEAAAAVPWTLSLNDARLSRHPLLILLNQPNAHQSGPDLMENLYGHLLLSGNSYVEALQISGQTRELHVLRPDRMQIIPDRRGWPAAYQYSPGNKPIRFPCRTRTGTQPILHLRLFHPLNDHYGLSPLEAAAYGVDIHNAAGKWSKGLLDNSARPSGALVYKSADGLANLSEEQFARLKSELQDHYEGPANAGRPLLLEGGLEWTSMGHSPRDMDFIQTKHVAAREIALAFGVPPMLLGIPGDNTYANYAEANRSLWRQTVLPLVRRAAAALTNWLTPRFGENLRLSFDPDQVPALASERESLWSRLNDADFLTTNEKRAAAGYEPIPDTDTTQSS